MKTSAQSLANVTKLGKRNPGGAMAKRQASGVDLAAQRLIMHKDGFQLGGLVGQHARRGYEAVLDSGIDRYSNCQCGKTNCKANRFDIPQNTLERFYSENFTCYQIAECIKVNRKEWLESDKVKYGQIDFDFDIQTLIDLFDDNALTFGVYHLNVLIKDTKANIKVNQNLLDGFYTTTKLEKIERYQKRKKSNFKNLSLESIAVNRKISKSKTLAQRNHYINAQKARTRKANKFSYTEFNKAVYVESNAKRDAIVSRRIVSQVPTIFSATQIELAKDNLKTLENRLERLEIALKLQSAYVVPTLLTVEQQEKVITDCKRLNAKQAKKAMHKVRVTELYLEFAPIDSNMSSFRSDIKADLKILKGE